MQVRWRFWSASAYGSTTTWQNKSRIKLGNLFRYPTPQLPVDQLGRLSGRIVAHSHATTVRAFRGDPLKTVGEKGRGNNNNSHRGFCFVLHQSSGLVGPWCVFLLFADPWRFECNHSASPQKQSSEDQRTITHGWHRMSPNRTGKYKV